MKVQSKCSNCSQWTENSGKIEDRCTHCGELIHKERFDNYNKSLTEKMIDKQNSLLVIRDEDSTIVRFLKRTGIIIQFIFVSFATFIIWLVSLLTG